MKKLAIRITMVLAATSFMAVGQDRTQGSADKKQNTESAESGSDQEGDDLIGTGNQKQKKDNTGKDGSDAYRNNRVNGNPNNTDVNEGSNRESSSRSSTNESSKADDNGDNQQGNGGQNQQGGKADPQSSNAPSVIQETSSQSGSPAVLSESKDGRDGTNNVQRAKPNMAGSPVGGQQSNTQGNKKSQVNKNTNAKQQSGDKVTEPGNDNINTSEHNAGTKVGDKASKNEKPQDVVAMDKNPKLAKEGNSKDSKKKGKKSRRRHRD
jgi:hypothetical protein